LGGGEGKRGLQCLQKGGFQYSHLLYQSALKKRMKTIEIYWDKRPYSRELEPPKKRKRNWKCPISELACANLAKGKHA